MTTRWIARAVLLAVFAASVSACSGKDDTIGPGDTAATGGAATGGAATGGAAGTGGGGGTGGASLPPVGDCPATPQPCTPRVLDSGVSGPGTLQVQDGILYWRNTSDFGAGTSHDPNSVMRVRLPDGTPEPVAAIASGDLSAIATDATHVYLAVRDRGVERVPLAGGEPESLTTGISPLQVVVDATHAYFTTSSAAGAVQRVPKGGGSVEVLASGSPGVVLAVDATHVYWSAGVGDTTSIQRVPKVGGPLETVAAEVGMFAERILVIDDSVYVTASQRQGTSAIRGVILRYPVTGGEPTTVASSSDPFGSMGADAEFFYVGTCPDAAGLAALLRVPRAGGDAVILASGLDCIAGATVDATSVYFSNIGAGRVASSDGSVLSVDKCGCP